MWYSKALKRTRACPKVIEMFIIYFHRHVELGFSRKTGAFVLLWVFLTRSALILLYIGTLSRVLC